MKRSLFAVGLSTTAVLVLVLTACAPAAQVGSGTPPKIHHTSIPTATKQAQAAIPTVRVPLKCAGLFPDTTIAGLIGTPVTHHDNEITNPVGINDIVARQYGSLVCLWGGADMTDGGYDQNLSVTISPEAAAGFNANIANLEAPANDPTVNTAGDKSEYSCSVEGDTQCNANMLVGTYWATAYLQNLGNAIPQATANANIQLVLKTIATALAGKTAGPAWIPPGAGLPSFCSDSGSTAKVNTALGANDFGPTGEDQQVSDATAYTQTVGTYGQCTWASANNTGKFTYLSMALLKGGAWVLPQLAGEHDPQAYMLGAYTATTIPGATAAVSSCSVGAQECNVMLTIGSTLVYVQLDDPSAAEVTAALTKIVADVAAS
jgi:hypothetical protein